MRKVNVIVLHCSASDYPAHDNPNTIRDWHLERGFNDIGYNFVITKAHHGKIHIGRPIHKVPAGASGYNTRGVHICMTGLNKFSDDQLKSAVNLIVELLSIFDLTIDNVKGHGELEGHEHKTCPNYDMDLIRRLICQRASSIGQNYLVRSHGNPSPERPINLSDLGLPKK